MIRVRDLDEAVEVANDSKYGLGGGVWSRDLSKAMTVALRVRTGTMWVNTYGAISGDLPFGGYGHSGLGREGGSAGLRGLYRAQVHHDRNQPGRARAAVPKPKVLNPSFPIERPSMRTRALLTVAALVLSTSALAAQKKKTSAPPPPKLDLSKPEDVVIANRKLHASTVDGKPVIFDFWGKTYSRVPGERDRLLFTWHAMNIRATKTVTDEKGQKGYRMVSLRSCSTRIRPPE